MGSDVEDTDGQKIGSVRNLILDTQNGQLKYAVIGSGGFLGMRSTVRLAPSEIMSAATTKRDTLAINATRHQWVRAPVFKPSKLASLSDPGRAQEIAGYFEQPGTNAAGRQLTATGADPINREPETLHFASDVIGMRVVNSKQQRIGEVLDLLVNFGKPHPVFAIVSTGKPLRRGHEYALPLSELKQDGKKLLLDLDSGELEAAAPFTQQIWDKANLGERGVIYSYSKGEE